MKKNKFIFIIIIVLSVGILAVAYFSGMFKTKTVQEDSGFEKMAQEYPEYVEFIDKIKEWQDKLEGEEDENKIIEAHFGLGMAWKGLADRTKKEEHYKTTLKIYQNGIEITEGKNSLFLDNAGNVAISLGDNKLAQDYYEKALVLAPGDTKLYIRLAEFYEYKTDKSSEEIIALLDRGINTVMRTGDLINYKEAYIERLKN